MSTQQRLQNLNSIEVDNIISIAGKKPNNIVLSFTPKLLVFQNFKPNDKIVAKFSVKNISKVTSLLFLYYFILECYDRSLNSVLSLDFLLTGTDIS